MFFFCFVFCPGEKVSMKRGIIRALHLVIRTKAQKSVQRMEDQGEKFGESCNKSWYWEGGGVHIFFFAKWNFIVLGIFGNDKPCTWGVVLYILEFIFPCFISFLPPSYCSTSFIYSCSCLFASSCSCPLPGSAPAPPPGAPFTLKWVLRSRWQKGMALLWYCLILAKLTVNSLYLTYPL